MSLLHGSPNPTRSGADHDGFPEPAMPAPAATAAPFPTAGHGITRRIPKGGRGAAGTARDLADDVPELLRGSPDERPGARTGPGPADESPLTGGFPVTGPFGRPTADQDFPEIGTDSGRTRGKRLGRGSRGKSGRGKGVAVPVPSPLVSGPPSAPVGMSLDVIAGIGTAGIGTAGALAPSFAEGADETRAIARPRTPARNGTASQEASLGTLRGVPGGDGTAGGYPQTPAEGLAGRYAPAVAVPQEHATISVRRGRPDPEAPPQPDPTAWPVYGNSEGDPGSGAFEDERFREAVGDPAGWPSLDPVAGRGDDDEDPFATLGTRAAETGHDDEDWDHARASSEAEASAAGGTAAPAPASRAGRNLTAAIAVGLGLGIAVAASLFIRKEAFVALASAAIVLGVWELAGAFLARKITIPVIPLAVGSVGMLVSAFVAGEEGLLVAFALTAFGSMLWRIIDGLHDAARDVAAAVFAAAYIPFLAGFAMLMLAEPDGAKRVVVFILLVVANDVGGYATGVLAGRHPMAPSVSPKKSWEGFGGSLVTCMLLGAASVVLLLHGPWWAGIAVGAAAAVTATIGDLSESMLKRDLGIKDMGNLLPGHGGVMDRLDSLLPTAPAVFLLLEILVTAH
jgi:phosphatidate cytidylyltransferase